MKRPFLALLVLSALAATGCGGASDSIAAGDDGDGSTGGATITLVAYSTPQVVYDEIIPAFQRTKRGTGGRFRTSFGASGEQSRAVEAGQKADVVSFSVEPDMTRLVKAGLVDPGWKDTPNRGLVTTSVVAFIVRKGNPKQIRSWDDLLEPGVEVLTPNPFTSGAAKWNLLGAYAYGGAGYVAELIGEHVKVQDKSGREALQNFLSGTGDVLLSYEYEATTAQRKGNELDYVVPDETIRVDITIAKTKSAPAQAQDFIDFVLSEDGQGIFAEWGYRPVDEAVLEANRRRFPEPKTLRTIDELGGWKKVDEELFEEKTGTIARIVEAARP